MTTAPAQQPERPRPGGRSPETDDFARGPAVGDLLPDFTLPDQHGRPVNLAQFRGDQRALVVFVRSVGWCPYCRTQTAELQQHLDRFQAAGVRPLVITPDAPEVIQAFTTDNAITIPVLADTDSAVIRQYGILNTLIDPDEQYYGIPFPGIYISDTAGRVEQRHFNREYRVRESATELLRDLGQVVDLEGNPGTRLESVSAVLGAATLTPYQRTPLLIRIELSAGAHVYGESVPEGFVPTTVTVTGPEGLRVEPARYPATRPHRVEGVPHEFRILDGAAEIVVPVLWATTDRPEDDRVPLDISVQYQMCTDRECFPPRTEQLRIEAQLGQLNRRPPQPTA